ncbi:MAG: flavin reductase [Gaiellaceae bacterium]|jgi:flavin reductase (DIM6/NTAB) family NADH-FMN oxidoreductase RutF
MGAREADTTASADGQLVAISTATPIWERFFTVAPLVLVATKEGDGYDVAPKHLAMPLGWENYFGFVCSPRHATYRNILAHPEFTVSFPRADQILQASMAAGGRLEDQSKPTLAAVPTFPATAVDGVLVEKCVLYLECALERVVDGFGENSLLVGHIVAASAAPDSLRGQDVDDADLLHEIGPLVYLAPGRFGIVRESYSFPVPVDFSR